MSVAVAPHRAIWATLAVQVGIGAVLIGMDLARPAVPSPAELFSPATAPQIRPYRPDLRPGGGPDGPQVRSMPSRLEFAAEEDILRLTGQIALGDAARFSGFVADLGQRPGTVRLDSSGGVVA